MSGGSASESYDRQSRFPFETWTVTVCQGPRCLGHGGGQLLRQFVEAVRRWQAEERVSVRSPVSVCHNRCAKGPNVFVEPGGTWYAGVRPADVDRIVQQHLCLGVPVEELRGKEPSVLTLDGLEPWAPC